MILKDLICKDENFSIIIISAKEIVRNLYYALVIPYS